MSTINENKNLEPNKPLPVKDVIGTSTAGKTSSNEKDVKEAKPTISERWQNSQYTAVRISYTIAHSIWTVVMAVGMFLAWLIALLAT